MAEYKLLNMKTGSITDAKLKHEDEYALLGSVVPDPRGEGYTYLTQGTRSQEYNALWSGLYFTKVVVKGSKVVEEGHGKFYQDALPTQTSVYLHLFYLDELYSLKVKNNLAYFSDKKGGRPTAGIYDLAAYKNILYGSGLSTVTPL